MKDETHQQILFSKEFDGIPRLCRRRIHKVPPVIQTRHLKQVDDVVDVRLIQTVGSNRPGQIGMAVEIIRRLFTAQQYIDVRITSRSQKVVASAAVLVLPIPRQRVGNNCAERSHIWQT